MVATRAAVLLASQRRLDVRYSEVEALKVISN